MRLNKSAVCITAVLFKTGLCASVDFRRGD